MNAADRGSIGADRCSSVRSAWRIEDRIAAAAGDAGGFEGFNLQMRRRIPDGQRRGGDDGADHPADEPGFEVRNLRPDLGEAGPELVGGDVVAVLESRRTSVGSRLGGRSVL